MKCSTVVSIETYIGCPKNQLGIPYSVIASAVRKDDNFFDKDLLICNAASHTPPKDDVFIDFLKLCSALGLSVSGTSSRVLHESLQMIKQERGEDVFAVVNFLATKPMNLAEYFCSGDAAEKDWAHYALSVPQYTHFTSPIRRLEDVKTSAIDGWLTIL